MGGAGPCNVCSYWDQSTYKMAMASKPDIVTIMLGTNDAKGCNWDYSPDGVQGKGDLWKTDGADMIAKFKALPSKPKVFVVLPPPLFPPWPYPPTICIAVDLSSTVDETV